EGEMWRLRFRFAEPPETVVQFERSGDVLSATGSGRVEISAGRDCRFGAELPFESRLPPACRAATEGGRDVAGPAKTRVARTGASGAGLRPLRHLGPRLPAAR